MFQLAGASGSNNRNSYGFGNRARKFQVVAFPGAISIHTGQQDLARSQPLAQQCPLQHVSPSLLPAAMREDLPTLVWVTRVSAFGINGHHDALAAKGLCAISNQSRPIDCRR